MATVREELTALAGIEQRKGETFDKFARRLAEAVDKKLEEDDEASKRDGTEAEVWKSLSPEAQAWFNGTVEQISAKGKVRGFPDEPASEEEELGSERKGKGKGNGKGAKAKTTSAEGKAGRPRRQLPFPMTAKITVVSEQNPKRPGSKAAARFDKYKTGMTVEEAVKAGLGADMEWDVNHKFISIS